MERCQPLRLRVAIVAAIEHMNATWAHAFLELDLLSDSDPEVRALFAWHFAEEIEHKGVANDVLAGVFPGYWTRLLGGVLAFPTFFALLGVGTSFLVLCDKEARLSESFRDLARFWFRTGCAAAVWAGVKRYFSRGFDPWDVDDFYLAERAIADMTNRRQVSRGSALGVA